jgi:hypothetical protein
VSISGMAAIVRGRPSELRSDAHCRQGHSPGPGSWLCRRYTPPQTPHTTPPPLMDTTSSTSFMGKVRSRIS